MATTKKKADEFLMSESDQALSDNYADLWTQYTESGDTASADAVHAQAEALRSKYGYSGGNDGSEYIAIPDYDSGSNAPSYTSKYADQMDGIMEQIASRDPFSYDYTQDPLYAQYAEAYTRDGEKAMEDTVGLVSARTGGLASSYAGVAGQDTYNGYMDMLGDKIPELEQLAYAKYQQEGADMYNQLNALSGLDSNQYNQFLGDLSQWNTDRSFNYGAGIDQRNFDYTMGQDQSAKYAGMVDNMLAIGQMPDANMLQLAGYDAQYAQSMVDYYNQQQAVKSYSGGGSSGGSGSSGSSGSTGTLGGYAQLYMDAYNSENPKNYIASNYKNYGLSHSTGLSGGYDEWVEGGGNYGDGLESVERQISTISQLSGNSTNAVAYLLQALQGGAVTDDGASYLMEKYGLG